ncbi:hypothetical protein AB0D16_34355 [Streptomyces sp. NPDC048161]|uniref:hypothetical protein n=1 Tax=Streptomyces sp. NPDC048161 TaxID=3160985 RepID=UPI00340B517C
MTRHSYGARSSGSSASISPSGSYRTVWVLVCMAGLAARSVSCGGRRSPLGVLAAVGDVVLVPIVLTEEPGEATV